MSPEYLARLFQQRSQTRLIRFDEQAVARAGIDDLSPGLIEPLRTPRPDPDTATLLVKLGMVRGDEDGTARPTVAGLLMATEDPRRWLPNATDRRNIMEKRGEGVPIILENSTHLSGREPEYRLIDDAELLLTIHGADP